MCLVRREGGGDEMFAEQLWICRARARPLQPIVCCPEFNPPTLALAATDPRLDSPGIEIHDLYLVAVGQFAPKPCIRGSSEIMDRLR